MTSDDFEFSRTRDGGAPASEASLPAAPAAVGRDAARERLRTTLSSVRNDTSFETASLFVPAGDGAWYLAERVGPVRPWHNVLDPGLIEGLSETAVYPNAKAMPGVGLRLSGLGCGSVAVFPVPGGARLVLDRAFPRSDAEGLTLEPDTLSELADPSVDVARSVESERPDDLALVTQVAEAMRRVVDVTGFTMRDALTAVRDILGAEQVVFVSEDGDDGVGVLGASDDAFAPDVTSTIRAIVRILPSTDPIPPHNVQRLAAALGVATPVTGAAFCREDGERELLVCGWETARNVSGRGLIAVARILGGARQGFHIRHETIEAHLAPERARWAHDIHDGITQSVTAAVIAIENLRGSVLSDPEGVASILEDAQAEIRRSLADLRALMADLSDDGVVTKHKPLEELVEDIVQRWRLPARISVEGDVQDLPETVLATALVVIREALTNAAKHSGASSVNVRVMAHPEGLTVVVKDNGRGFTPGTIERAARGAHLGTGLMRQRVAEVGGTIQISSAPGVGTKVIAFLPATGHVGPS